MDADTVIRKLSDELKAAAEKNDNSTVLLQQMDNHYKVMEAQLLQLQAEKEQLCGEHEEAVR